VANLLPWSVIDCYSMATLKTTWTDGFTCPPKYGNAHENLQLTFHFGWLTRYKMIMNELSAFSEWFWSITSIFSKEKYFTHVKIHWGVHAFDCECPKTLLRFTIEAWRTLVPRYQRVEPWNLIYTQKYNTMRKLYYFASVIYKDQDGLLPFCTR